MLSIFNRKITSIFRKCKNETIFYCKYKDKLLKVYIIYPQNGDPYIKRYKLVELRELSISNHRNFKDIDDFLKVSVFKYGYINGTDRTIELGVFDLIANCNDNLDNLINKPLY